MVDAVVVRLGASSVGQDEHRDGDIPIEWNGKVLGWVRPAEIQHALGVRIAAIEVDRGAALGDMSRADKQAAIRRLDEQGAFLLRGAVDEVAARMGVSKVTLYSYLNAIRDEGR